MTCSRHYHTCKTAEAINKHLAAKQWAHVHAQRHVRHGITDNAGRQKFVATAMSWHSLALRRIPAVRPAFTFRPVT